MYISDTSNSNSLVYATRSNQTGRLTLTAADIITRSINKCKINVSNLIVIDFSLKLRWSCGGCGGGGTSTPSEHFC